MNLIKPYKFLTYLLMIPTFLIGFFALIGVLIAFINPQILIPIFILICVVIYVISSYVFLNKILIKNLKAKKILKDLIKINGLIAIIFCVLNIVQIIMLFFNPVLLEKSINDIMIQNAANLPANFTKELMTKMLWFFISLISLFSAILLVHIVISFKLLKATFNSFIHE